MKTNEKQLRNIIREAIEGVADQENTNGTLEPFASVYKNMYSQESINEFNKQLFNHFPVLNQNGKICYRYKIDNGDYIYLIDDRNEHFKYDLTEDDWWKHIFNEETFDADCPLDSKILDKIQEKRVAPNHIIPSLKKNNFTNIVWSKLGKGGEALANYSVAQNEIQQIHSGTGKCNLCFDFENWN
jgi:hypothetical protein